MTDSTTPAHPTLAVVNARIATGDPQRPWADALATVGTTLVMVGSSAAVRKLVGPETRVIDARGDTLVPGTLDPAADFASAWLALEAAPVRTLARGAPADFVVVDRARTRVLLVVSGGVVTFERE